MDDHRIKPILTAPRKCNHCYGKGYFERCGTKTCPSCLFRGRTDGSCKCSGTGRITYFEQITCAPCCGSGYR